MQEKSSKNFGKWQRTPEKQKEPPSLWNCGSQGPLTTKTRGNSGYPRSMDVVVTDICKKQTVAC